MKILLTIKKWLKKSFLWIRHHWYIPLSLVLVGVMYIVFKEKASSLLEVVTKNREGYKEQAKKIDDIHNKQINERNHNLNINKKKLEEEKKRHKEKNKIIEQEKIDLVKNLKEEKNLASELDKEFDL